MDGNDVRQAKKLRQRHVLKVEFFVEAMNLRAAVDQNLHAKSLSSLANQLADVSEANYA